MVIKLTTATAKLMQAVLQVSRYSEDIIQVDDLDRSSKQFVALSSRVEESIHAH